jgi:hypothetical protein
VSESGGSRSRDSDPWATATREDGEAGETRGAGDVQDSRDARDLREAAAPRDTRASRDARAFHDTRSPSDAQLSHDERDSREVWESRGIRDPYSAQGSQDRGPQSAGLQDSGPQSAGPPSGSQRSGSRGGRSRGDSLQGSSARGSSARGGSSRGSNPVGDIQRWVVRNSAKTLGREIKGQFRSVTGGSKNNKVDVWDVATTEPPQTGESPECAWCPICRAARRARQSGPGLTSQIAGVGDALLSVAQDAISAVDSTLSSCQPGTSPGRAAPASTGLHSAASASPTTAAGVGWPGEATAHTHHPAAAPHDTAPHDTGPHDTAPHDHAAPDGPDDRA